MSVSKRSPTAGITTAMAGAAFVTAQFIAGKSVRDALYLAHWLRESGLAALLPTLPDLVYVGFSAGSMALTPRIGDDFIGWRPPDGVDRGLAMVEFSIFPHVDHPNLSENTMAAAERWAAGLGNPAYAIDDATAIKVVEGAVELVSEGHWKHFG